MTILQAITEADGLKPNAYTTADKIKWLKRLDEQIKLEVFDTHAYLDGEVPPTIEHYDSEHTNTVLIVPEPYDEIYVHYLAAQIDYYNREYDAFNATNAMFVTCYNAFRNKYNATHKPLSHRKIYY